MAVFARHVETVAAAVVAAREPLKRVNRSRTATIISPRTVNQSIIDGDECMSAKVAVFGWENVEEAKN